MCPPPLLIIHHLYYFFSSLGRLHFTGDAGAARSRSNYRPSQRHSQQQRHNVYIEWDINRNFWCFGVMCIYIKRDISNTFYIYRRARGSCFPTLSHVERRCTRAKLATRSCRTRNRNENLGQCVFSGFGNSAKHETKIPTTTYVCEKTATLSATL
jgi:hypothetical protein